MNDTLENEKKKLQKEKKNYKPLDRVTIDESLKDKLNSFVAFANGSLQGVATVNKGDIVNLILKLHDDRLSTVETEELRKTHFDVFKCLAWLQTQAKDAKEKGTQVSLKDLLEKSSELMINSQQDFVKARKPRQKKNIGESSTEKIESKEFTEIKKTNQNK